MDHDRDTGFIILAAMRYAIGRCTYAPSLVCDWIRRHWDKIDDQTRNLLRRDLGEAVEHAERHGDDYLGMECDAQTWREMLSWMEATGI